MIKGIDPRLAQAGHIKIGGLGQVRQSKSGGTYRQPLKYDHFLLTTTARTSAGDLVVDTALMDALTSAGFADADGKLRRLPVILHSNAVDECITTSYACYAGKRCACRGDGETATRYEIMDGKRTGREKPVPCPCSSLAGCDPSEKSTPIGKYVCKPHGILHVSIALPGHAVAGAVHRWRTTSIISIQQVLGSLAQIQQAVGMLRNVPLQFIVRAMTVTPEGLAATVVHVCHLELRSQDIVGLQRGLLEQEQMRRTVLGADQEARAAAAYRALIAAPAGDTETDAEQEEVQQEYHPETGEILDTATEQVPSTKALVAKLTERGGVVSDDAAQIEAVPTDSNFGPPPLAPARQREAGEEG